MRLITFDSNHWKSSVMRALVRPLAEPGGISLFGTKKQRHQNLIDHLLAEAKTVTTGRGRTVEVWTKKPDHPDNEWLDCLVGCAVAAAEQGATQAPSRKPRQEPGVTGAGATVAPSPAKPKRQRVRYL